MEPNEKNRVTFEAMLVGYTEALDRFDEASKKRDPIATYTALFEALNWAAAIDDRTDEDLVLWKKRDKYEWRKRVHDARSWAASAMSETASITIGPTRFRFQRPGSRSR
jgi:hypothetical protein